MNWAWGQRLPPSAKLILMALADAADEEGICWPRVSIIASKCSISSRSVQRTLRQFEQSGVLAVEPRYSKQGGQLSNFYRLGVGDDNLSPLPGGRPGGDRGVAPALTSRRHRGADKVLSSQEPPTILQLKPQQQTAAANTVAAPLIYPPRLSTLDQSLIASLLADVSGTDAQALLDELSGAMSGCVIKTTPLRYLSALLRRYRNGEFTPASGVDIAQRRTLPVAQASPPQAPRASQETAQAHLRELGKLLGISVPSRAADRGDLSDPCGAPLLEEDTPSGATPISAG